MRAISRGGGGWRGCERRQRCQPRRGAHLRGVRERWPASAARGGAGYAVAHSLALASLAPLQIQVYERYSSKAAFTQVHQTSAPYLAFKVSEPLRPFLKAGSGLNDGVSHSLAWPAHAAHLVDAPPAACMPAPHVPAAGAAGTVARRPRCAGQRAVLLRDGGGLPPLAGRGGACISVAAPAGSRPRGGPCCMLHAACCLLHVTVV